MSTSISRLPDYARLAEPKLLFNPVKSESADEHPLRGLQTHGPYSNAITPDLVRSPIRLALVTVDGYGRVIRDYLNSLQEAHKSTSKSGYFPPFRGFRTEFRLDLQIPQSRKGAVELIPADAARAALTGQEPERVFFNLVASAVRRMLARRSEFDIVVFYFPSLLSSIFKLDEDGYEFDLHHATKALTASAGIPSQLVLDRSINYGDRCSVLWSLAVALYAKAGGIPWKLASSTEGTAFIGLSYVLRTQDSRRTVLTCCSQMFDDQGHGMQFLLFTADDFALIGKNPFLRRADMRRVLQKTVELYVRQTGRRPHRFVIHKTTHFTREEREGAAEALGDLDAYELLQVQDGTTWWAVKGERGYPTPYPVERGTVMPISKYSYLLWTQGDARGVVERDRSFYQEGKGIPTPLLITQHAGSSAMLDSAAEILSLTKMNWNTGRLYNYLPVTIKSASTLGRIAKHMSSVSQLPYQFRMFM